MSRPVRNRIAYRSRQPLRARPRRRRSNQILSSRWIPAAVFPSMVNDILDHPAGTTSGNTIWNFHTTSFGFGFPYTETYFAWDITDVNETVFGMDFDPVVGGGFQWVNPRKLQALLIGGFVEGSQFAGLSSGDGTEAIRDYWRKLFWCPGLESDEFVAIRDFLSTGGDLVVVLPEIPWDATSGDFSGADDVSLTFDRWNDFLAEIGATTRLADPWQSMNYRPHFLCHRPFNGWKFKHRTQRTAHWHVWENRLQKFNDLETPVDGLFPYGSGADHLWHFNFCNYSSVVADIHPWRWLHPVIVQTDPAAWLELEYLAEVGFPLATPVPSGYTAVDMYGFRAFWNAAGTIPIPEAGPRITRPIAVVERLPGGGRLYVMRRNGPKHFGHYNSVPAVLATNDHINPIPKPISPANWALSKLSESCRQFRSGFSEHGGPISPLLNLDGVVGRRGAYPAFQATYESSMVPKMHNSPIANLPAVGGPWMLDWSDEADVFDWASFNIQGSAVPQPITRGEWKFLAASGSRVAYFTTPPQPEGADVLHPGITLNYRPPYHILDPKAAGTFPTVFERHLAEGRMQMYDHAVQVQSGTSPSVPVMITRHYDGEIPGQVPPIFPATPDPDLNDYRPQFEAIRVELERWRPYALATDSWFDELDDFLDQVDIVLTNPNRAMARKFFAQFRRVFADIPMGYSGATLDQFEVETVIVRGGETYGQMERRWTAGSLQIKNTWPELRILQLADDDSPRWWRAVGGEDVTVRDVTFRARSAGQVYRLDQMEPIGHTDALQINLLDGKPFLLFMVFGTGPIEWDTEHRLVLNEFGGSGTTHARPTVDFGVLTPEFTSEINVGQLLLSLVAGPTGSVWIVGGTVTITFNFENDSFSAITNVRIVSVDPSFPAALLAGPIDIAAGGTGSCTADYVLTSGDVAAEEVTLVAIAEGVRRTLTVSASASVTFAPDGPVVEDPGGPGGIGV